MSALRANGSPAKPRSSRSSRVLIVIKVVGALAVVMLAALFLAALPPVARAGLPEDPVARGEAFEQALVAAITKIRPAEEEWAVAIDPTDINSWLATRLPKWIEHDPELAELAPACTIRLASIEGALIIEDSVRASGAAVISLPVAPQLSDGRLRLDIGFARIGRLPIPGAAYALAAILRGSLDRLAAGPAQIRLADGRRVELREISCKPRRIELLLATLPASAPASLPAASTDANSPSH